MPLHCDEYRLWSEVNDLIFDGIFKQLDDITINEAKILSSFAQEDYENYVKVIYGKNYLDKLCRLKQEGKLQQSISDWLSLWLVKWRQRVKLMFRNISDEAQEADNEQIKVLGKKGLSYIQRLVKKALVESSEICGIGVLSTYITAQVARELIDRYGLGQALSMVKGRDPRVAQIVVSRVRELSQSTQPLIMVFLKVNDNEVNVY